MPRNSHLEWNIPYKAGKLEAVAYKKGKKITKKIETTDVPYELKTTSFKNTILADGADATVVNITVVDKYGRLVPDAQNLITFSIKGNAKIIGVGNGAPSNHEADVCMDGKWQRKLFNGKCQVIIQAGDAADNSIHFEANSGGLLKATVELQSVSK